MTQTLSALQVVLAKLSFVLLSAQIALAAPPQPVVVIPAPQEARLTFATSTLLNSPTYIQSLIEETDSQMGVNPTMGIYIAKKESQFNPSAVGDKGFVCNLKASPLFGQISPSYGLYQINRCSHPEVSEEQALDANFAIQWGADTILAGKASQEWTTWANRHVWFQDAPF